MKAIMILCDTVNRRTLDFYSKTDPAFTPNLNRLVKGEWSSTATGAEALPACQPEKT